jgi:O-antigen ligase
MRSVMKVNVVIERRFYSSYKATDVVLVLLAFSLQILATFFISESPIRISLSDFLLPVIAILLFLKFRCSGLQFISWNVSRVWKWIFLLTIWMTISLVNGIVFTGEVSYGGLINKYLGWYVLLTYFLFGGIVANYSSGRAKYLFFLFLFLVTCGIGLVDLLPYVQTLRGYDDYYRLEGLAGNPNAYGFLLVVIIIVLMAYQNNSYILSKYVDFFGIGLLIAFIFFSGSRSAWLGLFFGILFLVITRLIRYKQLLSASFIATVLIVLVISVQQLEKNAQEFLRTYSPSLHTELASSPNFVNPYVKRSDILQDSGVNHRLQIIRNANDLWQINPIFGVGLGGFLWSEHQVGRNSSIHSTPHWLLVETGLIGLLLFTGFFVDMMWQLWK